MQRKEIQRGDLFYYDFGKREGSVQSGERPVMVIQADNFNANAPTIIVAAVTAVMKKKYLTVSGLYAAKICSKFVATLSLAIELSRITK